MDKEFFIIAQKSDLICIDPNQYGLMQFKKIWILCSVFLRKDVCLKYVTDVVNMLMGMEVLLLLLGIGPVSLKYRLYKNKLSVSDFVFRLELFQ